MNLRYTSLCALMAGLLTLSSGAALADSHSTPSGSVTIDVTQVMLLLGGSSGKGKLIYGGKTHDFSIKGAKLGGLGVQESHLTGEVYGLNDVADFGGEYASAEVGMSLVEGLQGEWMENDKGVKLHLHADTKGVASSGGVEGITITLD